jgi:hypothetical protein
MLSREDVIRLIVQRELEGQGLKEETVLQDALDLHQAACERFGTWDTALEYAGACVGQRRTKREYSPEEVILKLREYSQECRNLTAVHVRRYNHRLFVCARRHFGTWRQVLLAAGINRKHAFSRKARSRRLDRQAVIDALRQWKEAGHSFRWSDICRENHVLVVTAKSAFRGWLKALAAAGIHPASPAARREKWDNQRIIVGIQVRQQEGKPLNFMGVQNDDRRLLDAGLRHFGSWDDALTAAGVGLQRGNRGRRAK